MLMGMATALTILMVVSAAWHTVNAMGCFDDCRRLPPSRVVVCEIQQGGALKQTFKPCNTLWFHSQPGAPCEVNAGMNVTMRCQDRATTLFRDGEPVSGASYMYTISFVQPDDEAEFGCRSGSNVATHNLSVQGAVVLSTARTNCQDVFTCLQQYRCCKQEQAWIATQRQHPPIFPFNVFGEGPIDIQVETTWLSNHFPVDLRLQVVTSNTTSIQKVIVPQWVQPIYIHEVPEALLTVTANNSFSSSAACFKLTFQNSRPSLVINESLPLDQEVELGGTATFTCQVGFITGSIQDLIAIFEWSPLTGRDEIVNCSLGALHKNSSVCHCHSCRFEVDAIDTSQKLFISYLFRVHVPNVILGDNGSTVACAVHSYGAVQWRKEATLLVEPAREGTQNERGILWYASAAVVLVIVGLVSAVVICVLVVGRRRCTKARQLEAVPLTGSMLSMSSSSSTEAEMPEHTLTLEYTSAQLPCIEVIAGTPATEGPNILSDEYVHSMDSGLDIVNNGSISSNDDREFSPVAACTQATVSCYTSPSHHSLLVSEPTAFRTRLSYSTSDLLDIPHDFSKKRRLRVYVSYSDAKADWVMNYLKPLIESFRNTEVTVHDTDMIAGHPISEERLRLILEADKVIVICSPDYTLSPWCQYELYQAITKQPSLAEGKIIPIVCGECSTLPSVITGMMALAEDDCNFVHRLRAAICRTHRASQ